MNFKVLGYKTNIHLDADYSINPLIYPFYTIIINRIVSSPVSRQLSKGSNLPVISSLRDARLITKICGFKGLYMGAGATLAEVATQKVRYFGENDDEEVSHPIGLWVFAFSSLFYNPIQMLVTRMQWMDNPNRFNTK